MEERPGNGIAVAAMVVGICAIVLCWIPFLDLVLAILAIVVAVIGMRRASRLAGLGQGMAVAGLVTGIVGLLIDLLVVAAIAIPAFMDYMHHSKRTEIRTQLDMISKHAKAAYLAKAAYPIGHAGPTPIDDCCAQRNGHCITLLPDWQDPVWRELDFEIDGGTSFHFFYNSMDGTSFDVRAVGDPSCDGHEQSWRLHGSVDAAGNPVIELTVPPKD